MPLTYYGTLISLSGLFPVLWGTWGRGMFRYCLSAKSERELAPVFWACRSLGTSWGANLMLSAIWSWLEKSYAIVLASPKLSFSFLDSNFHLSLIFILLLPSFFFFPLSHSLSFPISFFFMLKYIILDLPGDRKAKVTQPASFEVIRSNLTNISKIEFVGN